MDEIKDSFVLRPYYDPESFNVGYPAVFHPDKGVIDQNGLNIASKLTIVSQSGNKGLKSLNGKLGGGNSISELTTGLKNKIVDGVMNASSTSNAKSLNDLEWNDLINVNVWRQLLERLLKQLSSEYFLHLIHQPFEVAKLLLQVGDFSTILGDKGQSNMLGNDDDTDGFNELDDDRGEPNFFVTESQADLMDSASRKEAADTEDVNMALIRPVSLHTIDVLNGVMEKEGMQGVWRANNTQFIYNFLSMSLDAWFTGLLSPLLQIPDPYFVDIIHSPDISRSASLILLASCMTRLVLLPLDLIRVRFIISSINATEGERSLRKLLKRWTWRENISKMDKELVFLNILYSLVGTSFSKLTGVVLYHQFNIDKFTNTILYNTMKFCSKVCELFVKLPIENLLRRSQTRFLMTDNALHVSKQQMIVQPKTYNSIYSTVFNSSEKLSELWRGWRIGLLSIICGYGLKILDKPSEVLEEEKF